MADIERENPLGFVDKRRTRDGAGTGLTSDTTNYGSVGDLRAVLAVRNPSLYTAEMLNKMTKNDMVYALRLADDAAGIK